MGYIFGRDAALASVRRLVRGLRAPRESTFHPRLHLVHCRATDQPPPRRYFSTCHEQRLQQTMEELNGNIRNRSVAVIGVAGLLALAAMGPMGIEQLLGASGGASGSIACASGGPSRRPVPRSRRTRSTSGSTSIRVRATVPPSSIRPPGRVLASRTSSTTRPLSPVPTRPSPMPTPPRPDPVPEQPGLESAHGRRCHRGCPPQRARGRQAHPDPEVTANIFSGKITNWNDPAMPPSTRA